MARRASDRTLPPDVSLPDAVAAQLRGWSVAARPDEAAGLLLGDGGQLGVVEAILLRNRGPRGRFLIDPLDWIAADERARAAGLEVLGPWHSHPGGSSSPSPADAGAAAIWPGSLWIVVGDEITAWRADPGGFRTLDLGPMNRGSVLQSAAR